jgi:hypothetical protein
MYMANQYNKFQRTAFSFNMPILISKIILHIWSWNNSVWYSDWAGAGQPTNNGLDPGRGKKSFSSHCPEQLLGLLPWG